MEEQAMNRTALLQEIRKMRFESIYYRREEKQLTVEQAADLLGVNERTFRRWVKKFEEEGALGLADQRLGKLAHNSAPVDEVTEMLTLFETRYRDFTASHFYDKYIAEHIARFTRQFLLKKKVLGVVFMESKK